MTGFFLRSQFSIKHDRMRKSHPVYFQIEPTNRIKDAAFHIHGCCDIRIFWNFKLFCLDSLFIAKCKNLKSRRIIYRKWMSIKILHWASYGKIPKH
ncbi:hypothetical protein WJ40_20895 [Burkholderia cepacia]|nr:hypothetical protein WJ40_20895 [Burkholderia cepacia]